jgi:hypothetical protein
MVRRLEPRTLNEMLVVRGHSASCRSAVHWAGACIYDERVGALSDMLRDENRSEHVIVTTHPITDADRIRCDLPCQRSH